MTAKEQVKEWAEKTYAEYREWFSIAAEQDEFESLKFVCFSSIRSAVDDELISDKCYEALAKDGERFMDLLYDEFLSHEEINLLDVMDCVGYIEEYCKKFYPEVMI